LDTPFAYFLAELKDIFEIIAQVQNSGYPGVQKGVQIPLITQHICRHPVPTATQMDMLSAHIRYFFYRLKNKFWQKAESY